MSQAFSRHPFLGRLRKLAASFPETTEVEAWEHPTFRAGNKIFATFGVHERAPSISVKQTPDGHLDLIEDARFFSPPYVGRHGWIGIRVDQVDWATVADLVEQSYRLVALKRMVKALDAQQSES